MSLKVLFSCTVFLIVNNVMAVGLPEIISGAVSGGGGHGVVCRDKANNVLTVETLDLWEARNLYGEVPVGLTGDLKADVETNLLRIKDAFRFDGGGDLGAGNSRLIGQDYLIAYLRKQAERFLADDPNVLRMRGVSLTLTDDAKEVASPSGNCGPEQLVDYLIGGRILINQDLYGQLDEASLTALIVHESFYAALRAFANEPNSIRVRRSVGYVISGHSFVLTRPTWPTETLNCNSGESPQPLTELILFPNADQKSFTLVPLAIGGTPLIGVANLSQSFATHGPVLTVDDIVTGACGVYEYAINTYQSSGPVEFDREMQILFDCRSSTPKISWKSNTPGLSDTESILLNCTRDPAQSVDVWVTPSNPVVIASALTETITSASGKTQIYVAPAWFNTQINLSNDTPDEITITDLEWTGVAKALDGSPIPILNHMDSSSMIPPNPAGKKNLIDLKPNTKNQVLNVTVQNLPCNVESFHFSLTGKLIGTTTTPQGNKSKFEKIFSLETTGDAPTNGCSGI